ncbi:MAG: MaoC family dehydratase [Azonexus sp.]
MYFEDLSVGTTCDSAGRTVTEADIVAFAGLSGDYNQLHVDEQFAGKSVHGGRIAHGMLSAGFISAVLANHLPGPGTIYLSQTLKFKAPVRPGDTVRATVTVKEVNVARNRVTLDTVCTVAGKVVIEGECQMMPPARVPAVTGTA